jgi:hypothetical protein
MEVEMTKKRIICPERLRRVPQQFSWVDHRLVRDGHITGLSHEALSLYLLLVTVADADGLSYYSDEAVCRLLCMESAVLCRVRRELKDVELIAYKRPLYQVLSLDGPVESLPSPRISGSRGEAVSIREVFARLAGGEE